LQTQQHAYSVWRGYGSAGRDVNAEADRIVVHTRTAHALVRVPLPMPQRGIIVYTVKYVPGVGVL